MTSHAADPSPRTPDRSGPLLVALATVVAWLCLISWDNEQDVRGTTETGPYQAWQVVVLVAVLAVVLTAALIRGHDPLRGGLALGGTLSLCFVLSFSTLAPPTPGASLWPLGVLLVFLAAALGSAALAVVVRLPRRLLRRMS